MRWRGNCRSRRASNASLSFRVRACVNRLISGNGGTSGVEKCVNVTIGMADEFAAVKAFAQAEQIDLVVVGPEQPLVDGITDAFRKSISTSTICIFMIVGIPCFGPSRLAAQLEGSKAFSKDFMHRHNIPTAEYRVIIGD